MGECKHLVLSGAGCHIFRLYGAVRGSASAGMWAPEQIESVHGASAGAMVGVMVALGYDWDWLDDYMINRPWSDLFSADERVLDAYAEGGVFGPEIVRAGLAPLLEAKGMSVDVTLAEFEQATGVSLHLLATRLGSGKLEKCDFCVDTTPDCPVVLAVAASSAYPFLFRPVHHDGHHYLDAGLQTIYPLEDCLATGASPGSILGVRMVWPARDTPTGTCMPLTQVASCLMSAAVNALCTAEHLRDPPAGMREVVCNVVGTVSIEAIRAVNESMELRRDMVQRGVRDAQTAAGVLKETSAGTCEEKTLQA